MSARSKIALSVFIVLLLILWVSLSDGEHAALARTFLRNLLRQMF
jgi:hypothetical protein